MHKLRVLVVDDNLVFLSAARNVLSALPEVGCAEYVSSGAEALAKVTEFGPDLVLMDLMMPGINGFETMAILRCRVPAPRMYAVTLHDSAEYRTAALKSGADGLISKNDFANAGPDAISPKGISSPSPCLQKTCMTGWRTGKRATWPKIACVGCNFILR